MMILIISLHIVVCLVLIIVILIQGGRGQGLTGPSFASGNVQSLFGTRAADFLTKATSVSAICFLFTCIGLDFYETRKSRSLLEGMRRPASIDMETVKKALEQAKSQQAAKKPVAAAVASATTATQTAPAAVPSTAAPAPAAQAQVPATPAAPTPAPKETGEPKKS